jgi:E3 ubiquitin-protein ligase CCNP1IP1
LSLRLDKTINDANTEVDSLQNRVRGTFKASFESDDEESNSWLAMQLENENLSRKNNEIFVAYREKNKKLLQTQELYDRVKRRAELGQIQIAASDAVDSTLEAAAQSNHALGGESLGGHMQYEPQGNDGHRGSHPSQRLGFGSGNSSLNKGIGRYLEEGPVWNTLVPSRGLSDTIIHRRPL